MKLLTLDNIKEKGLTKEIMDTEINRIQSAIISEEIDPLDALVLARYLRDLNKGIMDCVQSLAVEEFDRYGEKEITRRGLKLRRKESGVRYDYKNDQTWNELKAKEEEKSNKRKDYEKILRALSAPKMIVDENTGEVVKAVPPIKTSKTIIETSW